MTPTWEKAEQFTSLIITLLMEIRNNWMINYNRVLIPNSPQETTNALTWINDLMCLALSLSTLAKLASTSTPPHPTQLIHHHCPWLQNLWKSSSSSHLQCWCCWQICRSRKAHKAFFPQTGESAVKVWPLLSFVWNGANITSDDSVTMGWLCASTQQESEILFWNVWKLQEQNE